jgi:hypothetical protein
MTIRSSYPVFRPSLNLNFARTKALDSKITFTRASTATFVGVDGLIKTAASGAARFDHNPATGESLGLLVEEARTNLITYSEQFNNAAWSKTNITITANSATAPDGTTTADTFAGDGTNNVHYIITSGAAGVKTISVFAKANTSNIVQLLFGGSISSWANFNVSTGAVGSIGTLCTASIQQFANGWYRCILATTDSAATDAAFSIVPSATSSRAESNSLSTSVYLWGAQSEASSSFPTSYIPTSGSTVTRAADVASMTGTSFSSWYSNVQGTICANARMLSTTDNVYRIIVEGADSSPTFKDFTLGMYNGNVGNFTSRFNTGNYDVYASSAIASNVSFKFACSYTASSADFAYNGLLASTKNGLSQLISADRMFIGSRPGGSLFLNGTIARLAYYPVRLSNAQLQALTS